MRLNYAAEYPHRTATQLSVILGGAYARDKNTSERLCAKNAGGAYARGGPYLQDTTVVNKVPNDRASSCLDKDRLVVGTSTERYK